MCRGFTPAARCWTWTATAAASICSGRGRPGIWRAKATLRVENTTEDTVELIYEITQKLLRRAEQTTPDIPGSIYSLGSIDYVNLVMQNDEVSN